VVLLALVAPSLAAQTPPATASEYQLKAAFVYNFANFVTWPSSAFEAPASPLRVCALGDAAFSAALEDTLRNDTVDGHPLSLIREPASTQVRQCHILVVARRARDVDTVLKDVAGAPVLTIGDVENFVGRGGVIQFILDSGHIRFDVNLAAAAAGRLTLSARMLQVARQVHR
jgi:hypothetical protein